MSEQMDRTAGDLVPLQERLRVMQAFRLGLGVFVVVLSEVLHAPLQVSRAELLAATLFYLLVMVLAQAVWSLARRRGLFLFGLMLITDGLFLAWGAYATGGSASPLRLVVMLHLVAVAMLASHRTSLKIALWHSMLLFVVHYAQEGGLLARAPQPADALSPFAHLAVFVALFWLVAVGTSTLSAINERELRRRRYDLEALAALAREMDHAPSAEGVAATLLASVIDTFGLGRSVVLRRTDDDRFLVLASSEPVPPSAAALSTADGSVLSLIEGGSHLLGAPDPVRDRGLAALLPGATNLVLLPLHAEGRVLGVLVCEHGMRSGSRIERRVVAMLERFAAHGALALSIALLLERLQRGADTDGLTGIANRRTFDRELEREVALAARHGRPVSVLLLDLDRFKQLNDEHGHQTGDEVLRRVAAVLAAGVRSTDVVARYGGEEFVVVDPDGTAEEALVRADDLRRAVEQADTPVPLTVSGGVADCPGHAQDGPSLVRAADQALYAAKRTGRNRIALAERSSAGFPTATATTPVHLA